MYPRALAAMLLVGVAVLCGCKKSSSNVDDNSSQYQPTPAAAEAVLDKAAPLCDAAFTNASRPAAGAAAQAPVLMLKEIDDSGLDAKFRSGTPPKWYADNSSEFLSFQPNVLAQNADEAHALACVKSVQTQTGTYEQSGAPAIRTDFQVRLLSWPDGAVVATTKLTGSDPPADRTLSASCSANRDAYGCNNPVYGTDPYHELGTWLHDTMHVAP